MKSSGFHGSFFGAGFASSAATRRGDRMSPAEADSPATNRLVRRTLCRRIFSILDNREANGSLSSLPRRFARARWRAGQHSRIDAPWESCTLICAAPVAPASRQRSGRGTAMTTRKPIFTRETFRFFRDLARHNQKTWMDANRERYQLCVVRPFRRLLEAPAPAVLQLDSRFDTFGRRGANFPRINRDTRFAKDKTPYRAQMYLKFAVPFPGKAESGQLYVGISAKTGTAGFRIYSGSKRKESALAQVAALRLEANPRWLTQQKKRLSRQYESYWYSVEKGEWTKRSCWPAAENWKKLQGGIVRRELGTAAVTRKTFRNDLVEIFRHLHPLLRFTSLRD